MKKKRGAQVGRIVSEETRKKIGLANSISLKGHKVPKEVIEKRMETRRIKYVIDDKKLKNFIRELVASVREETEKAFGGCTHCYGKATASQ